MPHLGPTELIIILVIVIAIFGAGRLASLGGALGKGVKDFRSAVHDNSEKNAGADGGASEPKAAKVTEPTATSQESSDQGA